MAKTGVMNGRFVVNEWPKANEWRKSGAMNGVFAGSSSLPVELRQLSHQAKGTNDIAAAAVLAAEFHHVL